MFLYLEFLESYKLGAASLKIESTAGLVSDTVLTRTRQQRHELRRRDLQQRTGTRKKLRSPTDMQTHTISISDNCMTMTLIS